MKLCQRAFLPLLLCLAMAVPAFADLREATISLSRDPEPPFCAIPGQTSVEIHWDISYATTPNNVKYFLQDPTRLINLEQEIYPGATGVNVTRSWPVPAGSVDGKYWIRVEYWSFESGNEANAEVTFYVCTETGTICATKLADTNCNGVIDPGIDQPVPGWWLCLTTPLGDDYCLQSGPDGQVCWTGIPLGDYTIYEAPMAGWEPIGPTTYPVSLVDGTPQSFTFLNRNLAECYHACCLPDGSCVVLLQVECEAQSGIWQSSSTCEGVICLQPSGACCDHATGDCVVTTQADCPFDWLGAGVPCNLETCPPPPPETGACCDPATGDCTITTEAECGFNWLGAGVPCNLENCPPPTGACCDHATGDCTITTQAACGFDWLGVDVPCNLDTCAPPVPTERSSWGQIKNIYR